VESADFVSVGTNPADTQYLQLVISASYDLAAKSREEIVELCRTELLDVLPLTKQAQLLRAIVIKETAATFSPDPESDRLRPGPGCSLRNLFLAGDWTRTGWPATMEGAVRSGYAAAEAMLARNGQTQKFLRPDLPAQGLARLWAR
jgi:zeta-carotene desaturase